jgi:tetratricopeptide (TPR) repeat protein
MRRHVYLLPLAALFLSSAAAAAPDDLALVDAAIKGGRLVQAQAMLDLLPGDQPESFDVAILRAQLLLAEGQYAAAERAFGKLAAAPSNDCRVVAGLGTAAAALRHVDVALTHLQDATSRCAPDWRLWASLGHAFDSAGRWTESKAAYDRALALDGPHPALSNDMAVSMMMQRRYPEARTLLQQALSADPDDRRFVNNLDIAAASMGEAPVRNRTDDPARWAERLANAGYAALVAGRTDDARAWLTQSAAAAPVYSARTAGILASLGTQQ